VTAAAAGASLACTALCIGCLVYLHLAPTGCSPLRNAVSEYGVGPFARWYQAQATAAGLAAIALAVALGGPRRVVTLLSVLAAARILIGWFPMDTTVVGDRTTRGGIHVLLAAVAFTSASWAGIALGSTEHGQPELGWAMAACALGTALALRNAPLRPRLGLIERGYYAGMLAWLALVAARLL
jgi:Protein of unknown function (DUF998)